MSWLLGADAIRVSFMHCNAPFSPLSLVKQDKKVFAPVAHRFISHVAETDDGKEPRILLGVVFGKAAISIVAPNGVLECLGQVPPT